MNKSVVVLDTNVILSDYSVLNKFDRDVYIPLCVIEEMDRFKKDMGENGRNARQFSRSIDSLREKGSLATGVQVDNKNHKVFVVDLTNSSFSTMSVDNQIIETAQILSKEYDVEIISKDINVRIKSDVAGIKASNYEATAIANDSAYTGYLELEVEPDMLNSFYEDGYIEIDYPFLANQYVIMRSLINSKHSALGRYDKKLKAVVQLLFSDDVWGIRSKNVEQSFAIDALLNDDIKLVSLVGIAGSGKTLISIAAALFKTLDEGKYDKILVSRPVIPMGKDIGYLPGTLEEKLAPWIQPIVDNLEFILGGDKHSTNRAKELIEQGMIKIEALTYIRGRSIPNQFILIDEAQNLSAHEIQTILTRVGEGTKIVLTGDPNQIDSPYLDATDNGLVHAIEKLKDNEIVASVTLTKGERSELADLAAKFL